MKKITLTIASCVTALGLLVPSLSQAQAYTQVEVWLMSRLPGSTADIGQAMVDHNAEFHTEAPNGSVVMYMIDGPDADKYQYIVGPRTFSEMDGPPITDEHVADWEKSVMRDARLERRYFMRRVDELTYEPDNLPEEPGPITGVRQFEVADRAAFFEGQRQVTENFAAMGFPYPRSVWCRVGLNVDRFTCSAIIGYPNWSALDEDLGNFEETFRRTKGDAAWEEFQAIQGRAFISRQDFYRTRVGSN